MRRRRAAVGLAVILAMAGCGAVKGVANKDAAQLERFKALRAERAYAAIAGEPVACEADEGAVCRQLHLIRGDACFVLAERGDVPVAERYGCAIAGLRAGIDAGPPGAPDGIGSLQPFEERLLAALRARQDLARSRAEAAPFAAELGGRARDFVATYPDHPGGYFYGGGARLAEVLADAAAGRGGASACDTLARIAALAEGVPQAGAYAPNLARLRDDALGARRALPECTP